MPTAAIVTFLNNYNFGSTLQAYALQEAVKSLGWEAFHLNYAPSRAEKLKNLIASGNSPALIWEGLRRRRGWDSGKNQAIRAFQKQYLAMTAPLADGPSLARAAEKADLLLCGSDQIWNPLWLNPVYFGAFTPLPKAAYAPSLGVSTLSAAKARRIKAYAAGFRFLSCREETGARLLHELTGRACPVACDPVCLLPPEAWAALAQPLGRPRPYLLCYLLGERADYPRRIQAAAEARGLEPLVLPVTQACRAWPFAQLAVSPQGFLGAVQGAAHILTDSFHMTAFAALMERPFTPLGRDKPASPRSKNGRIDSFLARTGLDPEAPQWPRARAALARMRREGLALLETALGK